MKKLALLAFALAACGTEYQTPGGQGSSTPAQAVEKYMENCSSCHGEFGEGTTDGPQIQNPVRGYATWVIRSGRRVQMTGMGYTDPMPAHDTEVLSDSDIKGILDYLSMPAHPTTGQGLYLRFCGNCHGPDGSGGRSHQSIGGEADDAMEKVRGGEGSTNYGAQEKYMPAWAPTQLSNTEVNLIVQWLGGQVGGGGDCVAPDDGCGDD
ncbi:MAG TPA: c-type cytochrome [Kofleriaceae bacterium]|jgi:mono/diheme cytochrome c family protein